MSTFLTFTRADAPKFAKLLSWLFSLPARGTHVGGGRHVDMPETAPNPCPLSVPGWTTRDLGARAVLSSEQQESVRRVGGGV